MTIATLTEVYRGYLLVETGGKVKVHPRGNRKTTLFEAASVEDARRWVDEIFDGPEAA